MRFFFSRTVSQLKEFFPKVSVYFFNFLTVNIRIFSPVSAAATDTTNNLIGNLKHKQIAVVQLRLEINLI